MDITFCVQSSERKVEQGMRRYFFYVFAPMLFNMIWCSFILLGLTIADVLPYGQIVWFVLSGALLLRAVIAYPQYWWTLRRIIRLRGGFNGTSEYHLTDAGFEVKSVDCSVSDEYKKYNLFFQYKNVIYLLCDNSLGTAFNTVYFPECRDEFVRCLRQAGVNELKFWSFRRWRWLLISVSATIAAMVAWMMMQYYIR